MMYTKVMGLSRIDLHIKQTLREQIADAIRDAIIKGILRPDERIEETSMANKFNISRTPLREAIRQLEVEGFIKVHARRGAYVAPITEKTVREYYEIKSILEGYAARLACSRIKENDIKRMEEINVGLEDAHKRGEWKLAFNLHNKFNDKLWSNCGNNKLCQLLQSLTKQFQRFRMALTRSGKLDSSISLHKEIINALRIHDEELVEKLVKENAAYRSGTLISEVLKQDQVYS